MGTPAKYLPPRLADEDVTRLITSLGLPVPSQIEPLQVAAEYHSIYLLHFLDRDVASSIPARREVDGSVVLVLRVSGRHLPRYKTRNEVGCMAWIRQATSIPVPAVLRWSEDDNNVIGHEFTLLEKAPGSSVDKIYAGLDASQKRSLVVQLVEFLGQLHQLPWHSSVGGLVLQDGAVTLGPPVEETFWQTPDVEAFWPGETLESMNPIGDGPYTSFTDYASACCQRYCHAIEKHPSLEKFRSFIPAIDGFVKAIQSPTYEGVINSTKYITAHKDLHFANIMCDEELRITAVLDWEFSGVVPACRWNPARAFLWNASSDESANPEKYELLKVFEQVCRDKGLGYLLDEVEPNVEQKSMQAAVSYLRAIVEVCPRGQQQDKVDGWMQEALTAMSFFEGEGAH